MSRTELKYKTFDELLDSVRIDFRGYDLEGMIEPQTLIKVARRVNYDLGLKINPSRSKLIEIKNGKGRLPYDLDVLNFALLCDYSNMEIDQSLQNTYSDGILDGIALQKILNNDPCVQSYTTFMTLNYGANQILHNLNTNNFIIQAFGADGTILMFDVEIVTANELNILSNNPTPIQNVKIVIYAASITSSIEDAAASLQCNTDGSTEVVCNQGRMIYRYRYLIPLQIEKSKSVSADCFNIEVRGNYKCRIKNGFLEINYDRGSVFLNYQSIMEDDDGNLLVLDHPLTDEYYEYALKQRILEDLLFQNEDVSNKLMMIEKRYGDARVRALGYVTTPDFRELQKVWEMNRKAAYHKYYNYFKG